jgi:hypothetical protein
LSCIKHVGKKLRGKHIFSVAVKLLPWKHSYFVEPLLGNGCYIVAYINFNITFRISQLKRSPIAANYGLDDR